VTEERHQTRADRAGTERSWLTRPLTRREFLVGSGAVVLGAAAACSGGGPDTTASASRTANVPTPDPTTVGTATPIKRVVVVMKENRSFDHLFGLFPGANGATTGVLDGEQVSLTPGVDRLPQDLPHHYADAIKDWNQGAMDGFGRSEHTRTYAFTQQRPDQIPNYWHWAQANVLGDNFFASAMGPSFPNHLYMIAGQSGRVHDQPVHDDPPSGKARSWGCDTVETSRVVVTHEDGSKEEVFPCFDFPTCGDLLLDMGIDWRYYSADETQSGYIWNAYTTIEHVRHSDLWNQHFRPVDALIEDIGANRLPPVTWVTPKFDLADHPKFQSSLCEGEGWATEVVNAIMQSPMWEETAIFITWDEWGGFYDHVSPPQIDEFGLGIRVPLLAISPFAKQGFVDPTLGEFCSFLRFIEDNWGLEQLTGRDRQASNLFSAFDFDQSPRGPDAVPPRACAQG
jgi:phospholipase C